MSRNGGDEEFRPHPGDPWHPDWSGGSEEPAQDSPASDEPKKRRGLFRRRESGDEAASAAPDPGAGWGADDLSTFRPSPVEPEFVEEVPSEPEAPAADWDAAPEETPASDLYEAAVVAAGDAVWAGDWDESEDEEAELAGDELSAVDSVGLTEDDAPKVETTAEPTEASWWEDPLPESATAGADAETADDVVETVEEAVVEPVVDDQPETVPAGEVFDRPAPPVTPESPEDPGVEELVAEEPVDEVPELAAEAPKPVAETSAAVFDPEPEPEESAEPDPDAAAPVFEPTLFPDADDPAPAEPAFEPVQLGEAGTSDTATEEDAELDEAGDFDAAPVEELRADAEADHGPEEVLDGAAPAWEAESDWPVDTPADAAESDALEEPVAAGAAPETFDGDVIGEYGVAAPKEAFEALKSLDADEADDLDAWKAFAGDEPVAVDEEPAAPEPEVVAAPAADAIGDDLEEVSDETADGAAIRWWQVGRRRRERRLAEEIARDEEWRAGAAAGLEAEADPDVEDGGRLPASWFSDVDADVADSEAAGAEPGPEGEGDADWVTEPAGEGESDPIAAEEGFAAAASTDDLGVVNEAGSEAAWLEEIVDEAAPPVVAPQEAGIDEPEPASAWSPDDVSPEGDDVSPAGDDVFSLDPSMFDDGVDWDSSAAELPSPHRDAAAAIVQDGTAAPVDDDAWADGPADEESWAGDDAWGQQEAAEPPPEPSGPVYDDETAMVGGWAGSGIDPMAAAMADLPTEELPLDYAADETDADLVGEIYSGAGTIEHRDLAEMVSQAETEDTELQALTAHMAGVESGVVGFEDVEDLGTDEEYVAPAASDLGLRVLTGIVLLALLVGALWVGGEVLAGFIALIMMVGLFEFYTTLRRQGYRPLALFGYLGAIGVFAVAWFHGPVGIAGGLLATTIVVYFVYALAPERRDALTNGGLTVLGVAWIAGAAAFAFPIVDSPDFRQLVVALVIGTVAMDVGAYFVGRSFGSRPLAPVLSPNKTVEGLAGGVILTIGAAVAITYLPYFPAFDIRAGAALGLVVAAVAPLGDLAESMIKRSLAVKDMGTILPGHGGVLDRVDAFLFVLPAAWVLYETLGLLT